MAIESHRLGPARLPGSAGFTLAIRRAPRQPDEESPQPASSTLLTELVELDLDVGPLVLADVAGQLTLQELDSLCQPATAIDRGHQSMLRTDDGRRTRARTVHLVPAGLHRGSPPLPRPGRWSRHLGRVAQPAAPRARRRVTTPGSASTKASMSSSVVDQ